MNWLIDKLIAYAKRTPFKHLYHADGSVYMERYWLREYTNSKGGERWFAIRLHWIATPDLDRHLHDHPWSFVSLILRGCYTEARPVNVAPNFDAYGDCEEVYFNTRRAGSLAFRWWTDRHRITEVSRGGVWTLFITFKWMHGWGFQTEHGKIYYRNYRSVHNATSTSATSWENL